MNLKLLLDGLRVELVLVSLRLSEAERPSLESTYSGRGKVVLRG